MAMGRTEAIKAWKLANAERVKRVEKERHRRKAESIRRKSKEHYEAHRHEPKYREKRRKEKRNAECARRARRRKRFVEMVDAITVYEMHRGRCGICGRFIDGDWHVDHIIPLAVGGPHAYTNVQPAHPVCNMRKHAKGGEATYAH